MMNLRFPFSHWFPFSDVNDQRVIMAGAADHSETPRAKIEHARGAPWVRKYGTPSMREILVNWLEL